jgi:hypothetical protein
MLYGGEIFKNGEFRKESWLSKKEIALLPDLTLTQMLAGV